MSHSAWHTKWSEMLIKIYNHRVPLGQRGMWRLEDFLQGTSRGVTSTCYSFVHPSTKIQITLIPVAHVAHPRFWHEVDKLCAQHESVLMEGKSGTALSHFHAIPPRDPYPDEDSMHIDSEGWEPEDLEHFKQPFSWGVRGSNKHTVVHAADTYDYECLPTWARLRFQVPFLGGYKREKHVLALCDKLVANGYQSFAVPWGAAHMPIFANMLEQRGYLMQSEIRFPIFRGYDGPISNQFTRTVYRRVWVVSTLTFLTYALVWLGFVYCALLWLESEF